MNLRDVRSDAVPVRVKPEPVGIRYDGGNGIVLTVCSVSPYASGNRRWAACQVSKDGKSTPLSSAFCEPAFSRAQLKLDAYAKRGGYARLP